ncbi:MAG: CRISPR-associated helicase Cas3' [Spirosomaceae bacterium]|nr:CRISPR-associated helicase Cas3' [Spirosomataceae bacterium]
MEDHIKGVLIKTKKRTDSKIAELAVLFHDLGKINPFFQEKLNPKSKASNFSYSEHAYLSAYAFLAFWLKNEGLFREILNLENVDKNTRLIKAIQILALIAKHHGHLPNLEQFFHVNTDKGNPLTRLENFLEAQKMLPLSDFLATELAYPHQPFSLDWNERLVRNFYFLQNRQAAWQVNALDYFLETQFAFACLIEADKRDASDLEDYNFDNKTAESSKFLADRLAQKFDGLSQGTELNRLRTQIREEAVNNLAHQLQRTSQRVFTLTAPTGAGKTFTLLALASEVQRQKGNLGILYALPFLSITEQVERIVKSDLGLEVMSVNSKARNERIEEAHEALEGNPTEENLNALIKEDFFQQTFDHPLVLTTFVQFFETLLSNRNSTLLKLPNFQKRIFLIDEVQALPPELYIFFAGWLRTFCERNDSYCILSTATMPDFEIPANRHKNYAREFFKDYQLPVELLDSQKYFDASVFKRYQIDWLSNEKTDYDALVVHVRSSEKACLIIVNTIDDSKRLFERLNDEQNVYLLNTHFTPEDRLEKIKIAKESLEKGEKVILVSTQLIEAGVDISFPVVYRDLCPLPSLIQSAGRCNRNNELAQKGETGQVYFFNLVDDSGKSRADLIYRDGLSNFLTFCRQKIRNSLKENEMFDLQSQFFRSLANDFTISSYKFKEGQSTIIEKVNKAEFDAVGSFRLIDNDFFGEEYRYYIPASREDEGFQEAKKLLEQAEKIKKNSATYKEYKPAKSKLEEHLKKMANRIITVRITQRDAKKEAPFHADEIMGIRLLTDLSDYSFEKGIKLERDCLL